jgi:uncharacterized protein YqhQ
LQVVMKNRFDANNPMQVGGQAVIEGVMMRAPGRIATAVRKADGSIVVKAEAHVSLAQRYPLLKLPILRGAVGLVEMLFIGIRTLNFSAEVAMLDAESAGGSNGNGSPKAPAASDNFRLGLTVAFALIVGVAIFFATPLLVTTALFQVDQDPVRFNIIAGGIRLVLLLVYLGAISLMKDVRRLFEYHGAEHKAVFAFEAGAELDIPSTARYTRFHPRCGTSFLLIVMLVSILLFGFVDALLIRWLGGLTLLVRLGTHLPLIPFVGGAAYEFIRISARYSDTMIGRVLVAPGLWLQKITTKEPDEKELEVALAALRAALGIDEPALPVPQALPMN